MQVVANNGQLTATKAKVKVPAGLDTEVYNAWTKANKQDAIVPYLDWATPTMYDTITAAIQELMAARRRRRRSRRRSSPTTRSSTRAEPRRADTEPASAALALRRPARLRRRAAAPRRAAGRAAADRLPLPAARARGLRRVRARAARAHDLALAARVGRPDAGDLGRPRQLPARSSTTPSCARRSSTRSS